MTLTPAGHAGADHDDLLAPEPANLTGALIGYARVSTSGQILDRQVLALTEAGCIRVFADKLSGKTADRPELAACLDYLRAGDTLVVPSLDRLSRSLQDLITLVARLRRRGARPAGLRADDLAACPQIRAWRHGHHLCRSRTGGRKRTRASRSTRMRGSAGSPARPRTGHRMRRRRPGHGACNRPRARAVPLAA